MLQQRSQISVEIIDSCKDRSQVRLCVWNIEKPIDAVMSKIAAINLIKDLRELHGERLDIQYFGLHGEKNHNRY